MRTLILAVFLAILFTMYTGSASPQDNSAGAFDRLKALAGKWETDSPAGGGKLTDTIALVSKGTAIEETIGTAEDNEVSLYTRTAGRIIMTHYCALTADGNQPRLEARVTAAKQNEFIFSFVDATNLATPAEAHMHRVVLTLQDANHFTELWTKRENGKDAVFTLHWAKIGGLVASSTKKPPIAWRLLVLNRATSYSPTHSRVQYNRG